MTEQREPTEREREMAPEVPMCRSGSDGDCYWQDCPQEKDNRANYQSYCPYAAAWEAYWLQEGYDLR